jgi:hypothetical protein
MRPRPQAGAEWGERTDTRTTWRNGHREKTPWTYASKARVHHQIASQAVVIATGVSGEWGCRGGGRPRPTGGPPYGGAIGNGSSHLPVALRAPAPESGRP